MAWTTLILTLSLLILAYNLLQSMFKKQTKHKKLPPGPKGLPILGHLHLLGKNPHQDFQKLATKHGPIMYMRFGFVPNIIVSSPQAAEQFLKINGINFAGRPPIEAAKHILYEQKNLTFASYGPYWRNMRKLCTTELLSNLKINSFQEMRKQEVELMIYLLEKDAENGVVVDLTDKAFATSSDMTCRMVFGRKYEDKGLVEKVGLKEVMQKGTHIAGAINLADYFPYVGVLDLQGLTRKMKGIANSWDDILERIINEHENKSMEEREGEVSKDFVDTMLEIMKSRDREFEFDRSHVKAVLLDLITAATDTTATIVEWILSELLKHPRVMKKVQHELEQVVGLDRMVDESDLASLEYLDMVIKESFRLHPVVPLLLHECIEECTIDGFFIPKKCRVVFNTWTIGRDPKVWTDAEKFYPERFVGSNIDVQGRDFELLPFGAGRRVCPGTQLGVTMVRIMVAQLVHCFDWVLPNGMQPEELDMTEEFGLVVNRAKHLMAIPCSRLHKKLSAYSVI